MPEKSLYDVLGVSRLATPAEIRKAYILRSKILHPDRFGRASQQNEWELANEMLKEVNLAYGVLGDTVARADYDRSLESARSSRQQPRPQYPMSRTTVRTRSTSRQQPRQQPDSPRQGYELSAGHVVFSELPPRLQERMRAREADAIKAQLRIPLRRLSWNCVRFLISFTAAILLLVLAQQSHSLTWMGFLALFSQPWWDWRAYTVFLYLLASAAAIGFASSSLYEIVRLNRAPLKCNFYVTPLYFIKTNLQDVWFWPLSVLREIQPEARASTTPLHRIHVTLVFPTEEQYFVFWSQVSYDRLVEMIKVFSRKGALALEQQDLAYFRDEDDFRDIAHRTGLHSGE